MSSTERKSMTVGEFRLMFAEVWHNAKDDDRIYFGDADLTPQNPKDRGPINGPRREIQVRFNEIYTVTQP